MKVQSLHNVNEISTILLRTPGKPGDLTSVLQHIAQTAQGWFAADSCIVLAFNPITGSYIGSQAVVGDSQVKNELFHDKPRRDGVTQQVLRKKDGVICIEDLGVEPQYHNRFTLKEGFRAFAGLAMRTRHRQRPLGVIYLDYRHPKKFSSTDYESFRIFAVQAAFLLQETWLAHHYEEIARIGQKVNQNLATVDDLFQELQTYVDAILDDSHTLVLAIYQPQTNTLEIHLRGQEYYFFTKKPLEGACEYVIRTQESCFIKQWSKEKEQLPFQIINLTETEENESHLFVPLILRGVSLGVLSIQHRLANTYSQEDLFVLQFLANYIALALHNMRLYSSLNQLYETGQLLTQRLESEQVLQATVDKIQEATKADLVVLYPYEPTQQRFVLPPRIAGILEDLTFPQPTKLRPDDIAALALPHEEPIFAKESATLYTELNGYIHISQGNFQQRENIRSTAVLPLLVGDEIVGVLFVNFRHQQRFDATQKLLMVGLAHYAAIAIKNAQEYGLLIQRRVRELEILQHIDRELNRTLDLESVLSTLLKMANEQVHADEASILLCNPRTKVLEIPAAIGPYAEDRLKTIISLQETKGITRWALEHKKPARVGNVLRDPQWRDLYIQLVAGTISELDVPLLDGEEVVGVLNFESTREDAFLQEDEDFLLTLAGQAVLAIKNAQAYEREKRLAEEERVLNQISKEIISQLNLDYMFHLILEKALELTHSTLGSFHLYDPNLNDLWMAAEQGVAKDKKGQRQRLGLGIVGYAAKQKQLQNVEDVTQSPWKEIYVEFFPGACSELAVPMLAGNELRGVLNVESPVSHNFSESDERLLQGLADLAVVALQNAQAYEREKHLAQEALVLNQISKEITSQLDPTHVFDLILEKALELTHSTTGNLMLYDPDKHDLWMAAERGVAKEKKGIRQDLDQGVVGYVARHKKSLNVDSSQPPWSDVYVPFIPGMHFELAVPLLAGNDLRGVLNVESLSPNNFSESDERLLQELADLAVIALQNAQAFEREKRLVEEGQVLNQISKEITSRLDHVHVFDLILEKALELTHSHMGNLMLYDPDQSDLWMAAERSVIENKKGKHQKLGQGIVGYAAATKQLLNVVDVTQQPWNEIFLEYILGTRSELAVPMLAGTDLRGVLNVESSISNNFSKRDERLLTGLADLAVVALQNAERYKKAEQEAQRFELLYQAGQELGKITDLEQLEQAYNVVVQIADRQSQSLAVIYRYDEENAEMVLKCASPNLQAPLFERLKLYEGLNGQVARERSTIVVDDINNLSPGIGPIKQSDPNMHSFVVTPILFEDQYYGNLGLRHEDIGHFRDADIHFYEGLAQQLASTIYRLKTVQARKESEQRAKSAEAMSEIGQMAFELTHRWDNDLGLVRSYVNDIQLELEELRVNNAFITKKLDNIVLSARTVLDLSRELKQELVKSGEAIAGESAVTHSMVGSGEPIVIQPQVLLEEAQSVVSLPSGIEIVHELDEEKTPVLVIHNLVTDILRNLISNAIDAMPNGGKITLKARQAGHFVALEVTDTGFGISQQHLSKIFDLFYSTKGSSGFGLWSALRNALRNHGNLLVKSEPGQGTTFTLLLPRVEEITHEGFMDEQMPTGNRLPSILARDLY